MVCAKIIYIYWKRKKKLSDSIHQRFYFSPQEQSKLQSIDFRNILDTKEIFLRLIDMSSIIIEVDSVEKLSEVFYSIEENF